MVEKPADDLAPVVLIVEDEPDLLALYERFIEDACTVKAARTGDEALKLIDHSLDVALLDRKLGDWTGDQLLSVIHERKIDCGTVMITAVAADTDIVELPVDDYLAKPVSREDLRRVVSEIMYRKLGGVDKREYLALVSRKIALEREVSEVELARDLEYRKLERRITLAEDRLDLRPTNVGAKHRPDACPNCEFRWDLDVGTVGFVELGSFVWKCLQCGHVVNLPDPSDRLVARR